MMVAGRSFKVTVAGLFLAGSVLAPVARAQTGCEDPHDTQLTRTFDVRVRVAEDVYKLGEVAEFRVKVARQLHGEVVGPVEGARVAVAVTLDEVVLGGGAVTDADGKAVVKVYLKPYASPGLADVFVYAEKQHVDLPCSWDYEREFGDVEERGLFRVVR